MLKTLSTILSLVSLTAVAFPIRDVTAGKNIDYTEQGEPIVRVEYLESRGAQYIDTGIYVDDDFYLSNPYVEGAFRAMESVGYEGVYGCQDNYQTGFALSLNLPNHYYQPTCKGVRLIGNAYIDTDFFVSHSTNRVTFVTEGIGTNSGSIQHTQKAVSGPFLLFGVGYRNSISHNLRCYYFRLSLFGEKVLDLVPVRVGYTGYMYDEVSGALFGNEGEGDFVIGPDL